ncbi:MAG TPA: hypothetical protein ENN68_03395 [Methanomicrobia archaeon]|nr:hypothetical protein [Methanomicrobia archaeon]
MEEKMKKAFAGKRKVLALGTVFAIVIVGITAILMVKPPNETGNKAENAENELPAEIQAEMDRLFLEPKIHISRWSVETEEKRVNIFVWKLTPENGQLNDTVIDGWTILVIDDMELRRDVEKLNAELERLKEIPEMQIGAWSYGWNPRTGYKHVEIIVGNLTPENQQLNGKMIDGWEAHVYKSLIPPKVMALRDPMVKERIEGKEYEVEERTKQTDRELLVDVYIYLKEPEKTVIATVDVIKGEVIEINETASWLPIPKR